MIKSMTAFARAERAEDKTAVAIEIRSYNSRYLDLVLRMPHAYASLEDQVRSLISQNVVRGRVEVKVQIDENVDEIHKFEVDEEKASAYVQALTQLKDRFNLRQEIGIDHLSGISGLIRPAEREVDHEKVWQVIEKCLVEALDNLAEMREKEGRFLETDLNQRVDVIEKAIDEIEAAADDLLPLYQERLKERITAITKGLVDIEPTRIAQEAAFLADRCDISEEIVRVKSHIKQFRSILAEDGQAGRKLNFLLQEFNREFNTIGSKVGKAKISHTVVAMKSELEKIREQVQNVE